MTEKNDLVFVEHILESINAIEDFSKNMIREELISSRLKQSAIVKEIEIIGEAAKNISNELKRKYSEIKWKGIVGARDKMIHHYFGVNLDIIWEIIEKDLPKLKRNIQEILKKELKKE